MTNKFEISDRTKDIIANFSAINPSLLFRTGNSLKTISAAKDIFATATVVEVFPKEFGIYDLSRFLGVISELKSPEFSFKDKVVTIREDNRQVNYTYAAPNMIIAAPDKEMTLPETVCQLELQHKTIHEMNKMVSLMKFSDVMFISDGKVIVLEGSDVKNPTGDKYMVKIGESNKVFKAIFQADKFTKLIEGDYKVTITNGPLNGQVVSMTLFETKDVKYYFCPKEESTYN